MEKDHANGTLKGYYEDFTTRKHKKILQSLQITEDDLKDAFTEYGEVEKVNIIMDRFSGQSKGFGFVEMPNNPEADKAIKALNGIQLKGRNIKVNQAKPKDKSSSRRPRY